MSQKKKNEDQEVGAVPVAVAPEISLPIPSAETRAIEAWAEAKGMLPQWDGEVQTAVGIAPRMNPTYWKFAAARALKKWEDGQQITEAEFDRAVEQAANQPL